MNVNSSNLLCGTGDKMNIKITRGINQFNKTADYWVARCKDDGIEYTGAGNTKEFALGDLILSIYITNKIENGIELNITLEGE